MSSIDILGSGAFGTALAIALAKSDHTVTLWAREGAQAMAETRIARRLPDFPLPEAIRVTGDITQCTGAIALLAIPTQAINKFTSENPLQSRFVVSCAKGMDFNTGLGPARTLSKQGFAAAQLTGPSFAVDIAAGLPTALTLACDNPHNAQVLQEALTTARLRIYRTHDVAGAEIGGALKNVIAIACGVCIGAGLGNSAHAALMTRGFAEILNIARAEGGEAATLSGLSGLGDLALSCYSEKSRNFRRGLALGSGREWDEDTTVEGVATAYAAARVAKEHKIAVPIINAVVDLLEARSDAKSVVNALLNRPLREE